MNHSQMKAVYEEVKTPFKYGILIRGEEGNPVDCPCVYRFGDAWYMIYVCMNKVGYETHLARSADLLRWDPLGRILSFPPGGWDRWQADGSAALVDTAWGGPGRIGTHDGKFWMSYFGGSRQGYETEPLDIGMAWTGHPDRAEEWTRHTGNPVLTTTQPDARPFERQTLYKSTVIRDPARTLGHEFLMYYNAKQQGEWIERIGMAVSDDLLRWSRYGGGPVVDNGAGISGDPQIVRMGDLWIMFYFGCGWRPKAFDTFACSRDLVRWTKWEGPDLIEPSEPWDQQYAHKPWLLKHEGVVYHYYCAVGDQGRVIALATSRDLRT